MNVTLFEQRQTVNTFVDRDGNAVCDGCPKEDGKQNTNNNHNNNDYQANHHASVQACVKRGTLSVLQIHKLACRYGEILQQTAIDIKQQGFALLVCCDCVGPVNNVLCFRGISLKF